MDHSTDRRNTSLKGLGKSPRGTVSKCNNIEQKGDNFLLTRDDVEAAFSFFDVQKKGDLRPRDLKQRLSAFYPDMTNKEFKFLLGESTEAGGSFTVESLWHIIDSSQKAQGTTAPEAAVPLQFDAVQEAFSIYDPQGRGVVEVEVLANIMMRIGFGELSQEETDLLIRTADFDKDGKINLEDFRNLLKISR